MREAPDKERFAPRNAQRSRLPPGGSEAEDAVVNGSPVDCQSRVLTEPAGETVSPQATEGARATYGDCSQAVAAGDVFKERFAPRNEFIEIFSLLSSDRK